MKYLLGLSLLSSLASATVSYDGHKVYRVYTGKDVRGARQQISSLSLHTWEDRADKLGVVDVVVAPEQMEAFESLGFSSELMHADLGASISEESSMEGVQSIASATPSQGSEPDTFPRKAGRELQSSTGILSVLSCLRRPSGISL